MVRVLCVSHCVNVNVHARGWIDAGVSIGILQNDISKNAYGTLKWSETEAGVPKVLY